MIAIITEKDGITWCNMTHPSDMWLQSRKGEHDEGVSERDASFSFLMFLTFLVMFKISSNKFYMCSEGTLSICVLLHVTHSDGRSLG